MQPDFVVYLEPLEGFEKEQHTHARTQGDIRLWFYLNYSHSRYIFMRRCGNWQHFAQVSSS